MIKGSLSYHLKVLYTVSRGALTNFAVQMEQQNITQNDEWFKPFLMYIVNHPGGVTMVKMLKEVNCPQFNITHITPETELLSEQIQRGMERMGQHDQPLFYKALIDGEAVFTPTAYAKHLYGNKENRNIKHGEEISFDDL